MAAADTEKVGGFGQRLTVCLQNEIALLNAGFVAGAAGRDFHDEQRSLAAVERDGCDLHRDADHHLAVDLAVGDEIIDHVSGRRDGNGEAEPLYAYGGGGAHLHRVDADDLSVYVDEWAAGVAAVECGIRLNERHCDAVNVYIAVDGRNNAVGQRAAQLHAERIADGVHGIADGQRIGIAKLRSGEVFGGDLDDGKILFFVQSQKAGAVVLACVEYDITLSAARDDMRVCEDITVGRENDARADHGAAVVHGGKHRDGGWIDLLIDLLNTQRLAVRFAVAELDLVGVGQAFDGRFAVV